MTTIEARVPDHLARLVHEVAEKEKISVDQIVSLALASQISAWRVRDDIATRAARGRAENFDRIMAKVASLPPGPLLPGDELPPGYVSPLPPLRQGE